jgi:hypothetical protein
MITIWIASVSVLIAGGIVFVKLRKKKKNSAVEIEIKPDSSGRSPIKKALLVGINKYKPELGADLQGCVNDVENIRELLINNFNFDPTNIRMIIDDRATKQGILDRLIWLLNDSKAGDELVFHFSGHGSQIVDRNGDELDDQLDEILCPHDLDWDDPLTDDYLAVLFKQVPEGVYLTMLCDSCHSASITRGLSNDTNKPHNKPRTIIPPFDIRSRSLDRILPKNKMGKKNTGIQRHVLISGCKDNQTSADAYIDGKRQGAFTWALTKAIRENPDNTWTQIHTKILELIKGYSQEPQLSGEADVIFRKIFGGK